MCLFQRSAETSASKSSLRESVTEPGNWYLMGEHAEDIEKVVASRPVDVKGNSSAKPCVKLWKKRSYPPWLIAARNADSLPAGRIQQLLDRPEVTGARAALIRRSDILPG